MWLLTTDSIELEYFQTVDPDQVQYAILSHTWEDEEVSFQDMRTRGVAEKKKGYAKVLNCCRQARSDGYSYAWVDTCWYVVLGNVRNQAEVGSIDKSSSAELSESINSMYAWYKCAAVCYTYLSDVSYFEDTLDENLLFARLCHSRWFTRGWTLQELIAPISVTFFASNWAALGTKLQFCATISKITGITSEALLGKPLGTFNVAERMSWAAGRRTTRIEDVAYSLLGLFDINMPLLYGEGDRAFVRLQELVIEMHEDYTIFAWTGDHRRLGILASSPDDFGVIIGETWTYAQLSPIPIGGGLKTTPWSGRGGRSSPPVVTSRGIKMEVPCLTGSENTESSTSTGCTILLCTISGKQPCWLSLRVMWPKTSSGGRSGAAVRDSGDKQLFPVGKVPTRIREIYLSRKSTSEVSDDPAHRQLLLLGHMAQERFKSLSAMDPVALAQRLVTSEWCSLCKRYARKYHDCPMTGHRYHQSIPCTEGYNIGWGHPNFPTQSPDRDDMTVYSFSSEANDSSTTQDPMRFPRSLDAELYKVERCLLAIHSHLTAIEVNFLLCCCVAMAIEVQETAQMDAEEEDLSFRSIAMNRFFGSVQSFMTKGHSIAWFTLAAINVDGHGLSLLNHSAMFAASIINIGRIFADSGYAEQNVLALAEAAFMMEYSDALHRDGNLAATLDERIKSFKRPEDVLGQIECLMGSLQPLDAFGVYGIVDFEETPWSAVVSWLGHGPDADMEGVPDLLNWLYARTPAAPSYDDSPGE